MPTKRLEGGEWPHPSRLPLGAGWQGTCTASTEAQPAPDAEELREHCNLGYPRCTRVPAQRHADAVRFSVAASSATSVVLQYVCELNHCPGEHGKLEFDLRSGHWLVQHSDARIHRMAECYLETHLQRQKPRTAPSMFVP